MLHRTLLTIIWYPITPILSLWLNAITFTIAYYKQRSYVGLEFVNIVMLGMQSVLLGIALVVNPSIREAFRKPSMQEQSTSQGPLPTITQAGFEYFAFVIYILSSAFSLAVFAYAVLIIVIEPSVWRCIIIRVLAVAQIINSIRFVVRLIASFVPIKVDYGCRIVLFLNNALTLLPVNMSIFCVVYLQMVVIHHMSPYKRWLRVVLMLFAVLTAVVPTGSYLYLTAHDLGIVSFCELPSVYNREQYTYLMLTIALWQYLSGVIGVVSVACIWLYIQRTRRKAQRIMDSSAYTRAQSRDVVDQSRTNVLHSTMVNIVWYPITPILSLWVNMSIFSVVYYRRKTYTALEYANAALLGLQSVFMGVALIINPYMRHAFNKHLKTRWMEYRERKARLEGQQVGSENGGLDRTDNMISDFAVDFDSDIV
ncbi:hypothetical protein EV175_000906 [Coemansia sp. RSA 1933]|nr:hypothetical protein EV175_000906 [Coemansia sp. RSA 1933]